MPFGNKEQMEDVFISLESNRNGDKINTPVNPGLSEKKVSESPGSHYLHRTHENLEYHMSRKVKGDFVYLMKAFSCMFFQLFLFFLNKNIQIQVLNMD